MRSSFPNSGELVEILDLKHDLHTYMIFDDEG
jgi:hypothetical protein